ncbi:D-glycero-beta-D-manno-heptose 1,7-bisphosphate 7-phosphatase, partial [Neisseria sp. P0021.S007]
LPEHTQVFDNLLAFSQYIMRENTQIEEAAQAIL